MHLLAGGDAWETNMPTEPTLGLSSYEEQVAAAENHSQYPSPSLFNSEMPSAGSASNLYRNIFQLQFIGPGMYLNFIFSSLLWSTLIFQVSISCAEEFLFISLRDFRTIYFKIFYVGI